ncbi:MAG: glutamate 5-kinase [Nitrospirota bacterium]
MTLREAIIRKAKRIVIKIGSSIIASKEMGLNYEKIERIANDISQIRAEGYEIIIVSSGAVVSGMGKMGIKEYPKNIPIKQAAAALGQSRLIRVYEKTFDKFGEKVAQILLTHDDLSNRKRFLNSRNTLHTLLKYNVIPIINENDTVSIDEIKFGDNDNLAGLTTNLISAELLIILSDVDGLFSDDPRINPEAALIPLIKKVTRDIEIMAETSLPTEGRGGMYSKVLTAKHVSRYGIPTIILNGHKGHILRMLFEGREDIGTLFLPEKNTLNSRKHWIAYNLRPKGRLIIDDGAVNALVNYGKSLLPSGIAAIEGKFDSGDPVTCMDKSGREVARGLVNYSSSEVIVIKGAKTKDIERILGYRYYDEIIHRNNMVINRD